MIRHRVSLALGLFFGAVAFSLSDLGKTGHWAAGFLTGLFVWAVWMVRKP